MSDLSAKSCVPCRGGIPPMTPEEIAPLQAELGGNWRVCDHHHLEKAFEFDDFAQALAFTNRVGEIAEQENHHPDILLSWGSAIVRIWTHKINGLSESDFVLAAKIEQIHTPT